jgi:hypothetical protein
MSANKLLAITGKEMIKLQASVVILALLSSYSLAVDSENPQVELINSPCPAQSAARVSISAANTILFNGKAVSLEGLAKGLGKLPSSVKEVCYNRANPEAYEPPPAAMKALEKIMETRLPISFYWDPGFQKRVVFK